MEKDHEAAFSDLFAQAVRQLDGSGRVPPETTRRLRKVIARTPRALRSEIGFEPEAHLGPFEALPRQARAAIVRSIVDNDRWSVRGYELGDWQPRLVHLLWEIKDRVAQSSAPDSKLHRVFGEITAVLAYGARKGPAVLLKALYRWQLAWRGRFSRRPSLPSLLSLAGIDPRDLGVCYARQVPQMPVYRAFWHEASRHNTFGVVLGIDLLPADDGFWFIEGNLNPGHTYRRFCLYGRDPFAINLVDFAARNSYRHLTLLDHTSSGWDKELAREFEEAARAENVDITLVDQFNVPHSPYVRSYGIPPVQGDGTLVVRMKSYPTSLDSLFAVKRAADRALAFYKSETGDPDLLLPPSGAEPLLGDVAPEDQFPNVVYKFTELDSGRGIYFLKATSPEHARALLRDALRAKIREGIGDRLHRLMASRHGVYQAFIRPSFWPGAGRHLYRIRAHILVTPVGVEFLSAHRVVSQHSVPAHLPPGIVADLTPYLVNLSGGRAWCELVPPEEKPLVARAALAAARGLAWAAGYSSVSS